MWEIKYFELSNGRRPVFEFIDSFQMPTQAKVAEQLQLLEEYGPKLGMPHSRLLTKKIYELRIRSKQEIRIFYAFKHGSITLLHAFRKKSQKLPLKELRVAIQRYDLLA